MRVFLIIPARNEAQVLGRWVGSSGDLPGGEIRIVVVDDHSTDGTADAAARAGLECLASVGAPGKAGAVQTGLAEAARWGAEVVGVADADVVLDEGAVAAAAARFDDPRIGMVTGRQVFDRPDAYDRLTSLVRRVESMTGDVLSVHGQLLLWRADAGAAPTPGVAADDLDLRMQVRSRGLRVVQEPRAVFRESKPADPATRRSQGLRRARAYLPALSRHWRARGLPIRARLQLAVYLLVPPMAPLAALAIWGMGAAARPGWALAVLALVAASRAGREWLRIGGLILASGLGGLWGARGGDAWEPAR